MGKDIRGIERGKCACGECDDFMRSDGVNCGYCGCLPTRHSKNDSCSSDSASKPREDKSSAGTGANGSTGQEEEKWKDEDLGWFPNPKGAYSEFSNGILPKFYKSFWATCPYKDRFRTCFVAERKRQWDVHEALRKVNLKLAFATSDNPAAAGRFMENDFSAKRHDITTIKNNIDILSKVMATLDELNLKVTENDNALFEANMRHLRPGNKFSHKANKDFLEVLTSTKNTVVETMELLEKAREKVERIFPVKLGNALKRKSRMKKQNRHKGEKRKRQRYRDNEEAIKRKIFQIQGDVELTLNKDFVVDHDILIPDAIAKLKVYEMAYLASILTNTITTTQALQTIRANLSKSCRQKLRECQEKQEQITFQNETVVARALEQEDDESDEDDEVEDVDDEEDEDNCFF